MLVSAEGAFARKGLTGHCKFCNAALIPKCGEIKVHHWAHRRHEACDPWYENETQWHLQWKRDLLHAFAGAEPEAECVLTREGARHIADVYLHRYGAAIEVQHSNLSPDTIWEREAFYGKMVWVVDAIAAAGSIRPLPNGPLSLYGDFHWHHWTRCRRVWQAAERPVMLDVGEERLLLTLGIETDGFYAREVEREAFLAAPNRLLREWRTLCNDHQLAREVQPPLPDGEYVLRLAQAENVRTPEGRLRPEVVLHFETTAQAWGRLQRPYRITCCLHFQPADRWLAFMRVLEDDADLTLDFRPARAQVWEGQAFVAQVGWDRRYMPTGEIEPGNLIQTLRRSALP